MNCLEGTGGGVFWVEENTCAYIKKKNNKIKLIKNLTSTVLEFEFAIRSKENFKDGVPQYIGICWNYLG